MTSKELDFGITGFDHVDLRFRDLPRARKFFIEQLRLSVIGESADHTFLMFGDQVLGLRADDPKAKRGGVHHIALRVESWTGLKNRLKRARLEILDEKERDESRSLYLKGPEGLSIELVWRPDPHRHPVHEGPDGRPA